MNKFLIKLDTINDVKEFVNIISLCDYDVDLVSGRYSIDAKSIMGIFSLDLSRPVELQAHVDDCSELKKKLDRFKEQAQGLDILDQLSQVTGEPVPAPLAALRDKKPRFHETVEKDHMVDAVLEMLSAPKQDNH